MDEFDDLRLAPGQDQSDTSALGRLDTLVPHGTSALGRLDTLVPHGTSALGRLDTLVPHGTSALGRLDTLVPHGTAALGRLDTLVPHGTAAEAGPFAYRRPIIFCLLPLKGQLQVPGSKMCPFVHGM